MWNPNGITKRIEKKLQKLNKTSTKTFWFYETETKTTDFEALTLLYVCFKVETAVLHLL